MDWEDWMIQEYKDDAFWGEGWSKSDIKNAWDYQQKRLDKLKNLAQELLDDMEEYEKYGELAGIDSDLIQRAKRILEEV